METFRIEQLSFSYPEQSACALSDISLTIQRGAFWVLCGPSGCGKSTLLRHLKPTLAPHGCRQGRILFEGRPLEALDHRTQSQCIGFVQQDPENQLVTDKVWHELAFGLESLGYDTPTIRRRVAEMAAFFGIESWFYRDVADLSGGQKQLLNLASVMTMQPSVLILDEPTSQLDPIAASEFLAALGRINRELGTTVILTEHRLEEALPMATAVAVLDGGRLLCTGTPAEVGAALKSAGHGMFLAMPAAMRIWAAAESAAPCPVTVRDGRTWLAAYAAERPLAPLPPEPVHTPGPAVLELENVWFRYEKDLPDVVRGLTLTLRRGEFLTLLGGNGAGKSTTLKLASGLLRPLRGRIGKGGSIGVLPQNPQTLFLKKTVREDLFEILRDRNLPKSEQETRVCRMTVLCQLEGLLDRHPYDLSGGEQQRLALAKILLLEPEILLLDEPTKGLDAEFKQTFASILQELLRQGTAILMVSHDVEFCARYAHRCALFFDGAVVAEDTPRRFFSGSSFYTTAANRIARGVIEEAVTAEDAICACSGKQDDPPPPQEPLRPEPPAPAEKKGVQSVDAPRPDKRRLPARTRLAAALILLLIPLTLFIGQAFWGGRKYYFISLLILLEIMLPFFLIFEGRKPQARELVVIAALCALGVAGRAALFMLPQFKPVMALTIVAGVALGGESGFLVGALTMLLSNMLFSQGPWTPWQMFAMGIIGFLAGLLFRKGLLPRSRAALCVFGALSGILIYGGIMNPASALMWSQAISWKLILSCYVTGFPMDCVQSVGTAVFLWFAAEPMLEKLDRIKVKYGLLE
ncbi:MAG: ATP-binding cassette domain-containing protein [Oscillibacter sp.]|nr:ATP-binding cassette domain-containing protein [Oscillibacter sp.]